MKRSLFVLALIIFVSVAAAAQGSGFSFQGRLNDGTNPANGPYDLQFKLYDAIAGGGQIGSTLSRPATGLVNGVFSVTLDFGPAAFNNPSAVFIEIAVKPGGSTNAYTILGPRQQLTVVPFALRADRASTADAAGVANLAIRAVNASDADRAAIATEATNALNLAGSPAASYAKLEVINPGQFITDGNVRQSLNSNGLVKAMLEVDSVGNIVRCYNSVTNANSGNCGFTVTSPLTGVKRIDFGFPVIGRFIALSSSYTNTGGVGENNRGANYRGFNNTSIEVFTFIAGNSADTDSAPFMLILY